MHLLGGGVFVFVEVIWKYQKLCYNRRKVFDEVDDDLGSTLKICFNALKKENYSQFMKIFNMFQKNQGKLAFIAVISCK